MNETQDGFYKIWRPLLQHSNDIITRWDKNIKLVYANEIFLSLFQCALDVVINKSPEEIFIPLDAGSKVADKLSEVFKDGQPYDLNIRLLCGKESLHISFRFIPETDEHGTIFNILGMARNMTSARATELSLKKSEVMLSEAERIANIGSWEKNLLTGELIWSEGLYNIYGISNRSLKPSTAYFLDHIVHPSDKTRIAAYIRDVSAGNYYSTEYKIVTPAGKVKIISATVKGYKNDTGEIDIVRGISKDVTKEKHTARNLQETADFVRHIAEATPDIIFIMNIDTKELIYANKQFTTMLHYTDEQTNAMASTIYDIMYPDDIPAMIEHVENMRTAADGELRTIEYRLIDAYGKTHWFIDRNAVFKRDSNNIPIEKIGISHEITDEMLQKQEILSLNKTLERKNKELGDLNAELTQFFYVAGHDLKEPLRKAYSFLEMILTKEAPNITDAGRSFFRRAQGAIQRVNLITDDIVAFSQINSEIAPPKIVDLSKTLRNVIANLDSAITAAGAIINYNKLPDIIGYEQLLYLLFYHLVDNSIKFSRPDIAPHVNIEYTIIPGTVLTFPGVQENKQYLMLEFKDNGRGFDKKDSERIFKLFEKIESKNKAKGSGIGLAICKKIADLHHGYIYATSMGTGAVFTCILPIS